MKKKQSERIQVDVNAFHIAETADVPMEFALGDNGQPSKFRMVGYSGNVIKNHWYWGNLAIDLEGIRFSKKKFPILRDHMTSMELAFSTKPDVDMKEGLVYTEKNTTFLDNEVANKFKKNSSEGFPYQASISGKPLIVERVSEGETVEVNGRKLIGPGSVWRATEFRECSICVFGYDDKTSAQVFSRSGKHVDVDIESIRTEIPDEETEVLSMNIDEFKEKFPDEYAIIVQTAEETASAAIKDEHAAQLAKKDEEIASLTTANTDLNSELKATTDRVLSLEKKDTLRDERDMDNQAAAIWAQALSDSGLPEWLYPKVQKHVQRKDHMNEGAFDKESFLAAVKAEITDWEAHSKSDEGVHGFALISKGAEGHDSFGEQLKPDTMVNRMLGYVGQTPDTKQ